MSLEDALLKIIVPIAFYCAGFVVGMRLWRKKFKSLEASYEWIRETAGLEERTALAIEINRVPGVESVPGIGKERGAAVREYFRGILGGET